MSSAPPADSARIVATSADAAALPSFGGGLGVLSARRADVGADRERRRRQLLRKIAIVVGIPGAFLWYRLIDGRPFNVFALPHISMITLLPLIFIIAIVGAVVVPGMASGRSPHMMFRPEQIDIRLSDVVGIDAVQRGSGALAEPLPGPPRVHREDGRAPAPRPALRGTPGHRQDPPGPAPWRRGRRAVPVRLGDVLPVDVLRRHRAQDPPYFKALRTTAAARGRRIGFIEEIDAIAGSRRGVSAMSGNGFGSASSGLIRNRNLVSGTEGIVNELLVQLQSFEEPTTGGRRSPAGLADVMNRCLPPNRQLRKPRPPEPNVLIDRRDQPSRLAGPGAAAPGPLRPAADVRPAGQGRRAGSSSTISWSSSSHGPELDDIEQRDALAAVTSGWTPR